MGLTASSSLGGELRIALRVSPLLTVTIKAVLIPCPCILLSLPVSLVCRRPAVLPLLMSTLSPRRKSLDHLSDYRSCAERCSYRSNKLPVQNKTLLRVSARRLKVAIWVVWPNPNPVPPHNWHE